MGNVLSGAALITGTVIGAGFLALPYVFAKSGFIIGSIELLIIMILMLITALYLGETVLRTKDHHQLTGYAEKYLGHNGKRIMFLSLIIGVYTSLIAYLIAQGQSWSFLLFGSPEYSMLLGVSVWVGMSAIIYFDIKAVRKGEILGLTLLIILMLSLIIKNSSSINLENLSSIYPDNLFLPIGVIVFAFLGFSAIPEIARFENKSVIKKSIILAFCIISAIYLAFATLVIGVQGNSTPEIATLSLGAPFILLGIITTFGAYLAHSIALMDAFTSDYKASKFESWLFTCLIPIAIYVILELTSNSFFEKILGIGGLISGSLVMSLIILMAGKAKIHGDRHPEYQVPYSKYLIIVILVLLLTSLAMRVF